MTRLALLRHAATEWNTTGRLQGRADVPLGEAGAAAAAQWRLPADLAGFHWVTSPLVRCRRTAELLRATHPGAPAAAVEARLIEMSFGEWEGRTLADLRQAHGQDMAAWEARGLDFSAPGGESPRQVQQRLAPWLAELGAAGGDTLAICHKGVIRAVYALASGWSMTTKPPLKLRPDRVHLFHLAADGRPTIERLNLPLAAAASAP